MSEKWPSSVLDQTWCLKDKSLTEPFPVEFIGETVPATVKHDFRPYATWIDNTTSVAKRPDCWVRPSVAVPSAEPLGRFSPQGRCNLHGRRRPQGQF